MAKSLDAERGLAALGRWSRWRMAVYFTGAFTYVFAAMHMMAIVFVGMEPIHHCEVPDGLAYEEAIPMTSTGELEHCKHYSNYSSASNDTISGCPLGWHYGDEVYSTAHEWDTVCDKSYMVSTAQTILVVGVMVGAATMSTLADRYGRKKIIIISILCISGLGFIVAWMKHYWLFALFRFFIGVFQQGIILAGFIFCCELFPIADRTVAGLLMQVAWVLGTFFLVFFAYFIRNWHHLMLAISVPGVLAIPMIWIIPESVPWLAARGRLREAKEVLNKAARWSKVRLPPQFQLTKEDEKLLNPELPPEPVKPISRRRSSVAVAVRRSSVAMAVRKMSRAALEPDGVIHNYTFMDIVRSKRLLSFSLIMAYLWCTSALVYYGLALNTGSLAGNAYLNFFLSSLVEVPATLLSCVMLQYMGRRIPLLIFHLIAGIPLFLTLFIPETTPDGKSLKMVVTVLSMIGRFGISGCFASVFLYAPELFPTTIRGAGIGIASVGARIGNLIAPFTPLVMKYVAWLPNVIFGCMCILAAVLVMLLPETLGRPLPQTIKEVEQWSRTLTPEEKAKFKASKAEAKAEEERLKAEANEDI